VARVERIDAVVIVLIGAMYLVFAYLLTWFDSFPELATKCQFLLMMGTIGVMARMFWAFGFQEYLRPDLNVSGSRLFLTIVSALMLVLTAGAVWSQIQPGLSLPFLAGTTVTVKKAFFSLAAISEELFFTWAILLGGIVLLGQRSLVFYEALRIPAEPLALIGASLLFAMWHTAVYGTATTALSLMFVYRFLFGLSYILAGYLWGERYMGIAMLSHVTINLLAVS